MLLQAAQSQRNGCMPFAVELGVDRVHDAARAALVALKTHAEPPVWNWLARPAGYENSIVKARQRIGENRSAVVRAYSETGMLSRAPVRAMAACVRLAA